MLVRPGMIVSGAPLVPTIASFSISTLSKAVGCAPVQGIAVWTINNADNANFKLVIAETGAEFSCATTAGTTVYGASNYTTGVSFGVFLTLTLRIVRRADSAVMSSQATTSTGAPQMVGGPC